MSVDGYDYEGVEIYDPFREGLGTSHPGWIHYSMTMLAEHPSLTLEHNMIPKFMSVAFAAASALLIAVPATAVGDNSVKLSQRQAAEIYSSIRWLLAADGKTCPAGQVVAAGIVTGGSTPAGGSQATTIMFNHGGKIVINRTWDSGIGNKLTVSTKIDC